MSHLVQYALVHLVPCALEDAVLEFAGCVIVVSHDRFFMDKLCTHILSFEGESTMTFFEGNFNDYEEDKRRRLGEAAVERPPLSGGPAPRRRRVRASPQGVGSECEPRGMWLPVAVSCSGEHSRARQRVPAPPCAVDWRHTMYDIM